MEKDCYVGVVRKIMKFGRKESALLGYRMTMMKCKIIESKN